MSRLTDSQWGNIFRNLKEVGLYVEVTWLDPGDSSGGEWCLHSGDEMFEDGFNTEEEAIKRLRQLEKKFL